MSRYAIMKSQREKEREEIKMQYKKYDEWCLCEEDKNELVAEIEADEESRLWKVEELGDGTFVVTWEALED